MNLKVAIVCCLAALAHAVPRRVPRIAGGENAEPAQYPYYVSLYYKELHGNKAISFCGGAILSNQWILTAAYCVRLIRNPSEAVVKAGNIYYRKSAETEQSSDVTAMFTHPSYNDSLGPYDIGLMKLETPLKFNSFVAPVALPEAESIPTGTAMIAGLGSITHMTNVQLPNSLQAVTLTIIDNDECQKQIKDAGGDEVAELYFLDDLRFCTSSTETNQGYCLNDTGDSIVVKEDDKNIVVGIATFGFAADCQTPRLPSIYTRVSAFNDWIRETMNKN